MTIEKAMQAVEEGNRHLAQGLDYFRHAAVHFNNARNFIQSLPNAPAAVPLQEAAALPTASVEYQGLEVPATAAPVQAAAPTASTAPTAVAAPAPLPTPASAPSGPTPVADALDAAAAAAAQAQATLEQRFITAISRLRGPQSIFHTYLSPDVLPGAKGFLKPHVAGYRAYHEDISMMSSQLLETWPAGFYTATESKQLQFMMKTPSALWVIADLRAENPNVDIAVVPAVPGTQRRPLGQYSLPELDFLAEELTHAFQALGLESAPAS